MNIRRQYSLPNCTLVLEGLNDGLGTNPLGDGRPLLSILVNVECYFTGSPQKLNGGRIFLENLVKVVSSYAQEFLSGIHHPQEISQDGDRIQIEKIEGKDLHRLTWQPPPDMNGEKVEIELTTVQLFDLVEAVDQFFADSSTLPDLNLKLQPVSRRYRQPDEPLSQRVVSPMLGMTGLILAAIATLMLPVPSEIKKPEPKPQVTPSPTIPTGRQPLPPSPR